MPEHELDEVNLSMTEPEDSPLHGYRGEEASAPAPGVSTPVASRDTIVPDTRARGGFVFGGRSVQANAKAESASVVMRPPWQMRWPFNMSSRTVMRKVARPGAIASTVMPSDCDARSAANMLSRTASASCCGVSAPAVSTRLIGR